MEHETLWGLLTDVNHWLLEIIILIVFDGLIGALLWPFVLRPIYQRWSKHHQSDDERVKVLEGKVKELERKIANV